MRFHSLLLATALSGFSTTAEAQIPPTPVPPVAIAGAFQTTDAGSWVGLDGRQSHNPGGGALTFKWTQTGGPSIVLYDDDQPTAYFRTDPGIAPATYIIRLKVTNALGQKDGSGLKVTVIPNVAEFVGNSDSLATYNPLGALSRREAQHLARRVAYDMTPAEIQAIQQNGLVPTVQALMTTATTPQSVFDDAVAYFTDTPHCENNTPPVYWGSQKENQHYLLHLFLNDRDNVLKWRLFYFWHDRFATSTKGIRPAVKHWRYQHISMIETNVFDTSHHAFLEELSTDGAMMEWLNILFSTAAAPNENYMRELMELFAIGLDEYTPMLPNFTELDVQNGAKALTGWDVAFPSPMICANRSGLMPYFDIANHDTGDHPLFENYSFGTVTDVSTVIRACLWHPAASRYVATNLFKYFVGFEPSTAVVDTLATDIVNDGWNLQPTIEKVLVSSAMFSPEARKAKIAAPLDFCLGALRKFEFPFSVPALRDRFEIMGQSLLEPPSVKGWPDDESWIGQQALVDRMTFINEMLSIATNAANLPDLPNRIAPFLPADQNLKDAASYLQSLFRGLDIDNEELNDALFTRLMSYMNTDPMTGNNDRFDTSSLDHLHSRGAGAIYHGYTLSIGIHN